MRALAILLGLSGCTFLTADLEDQAPVRTVAAPEGAAKFGQALVALPPGTCATAGALVVAGKDNRGPRLDLITFGDSGGSSRTPINLNGNLVAVEDIVAMDGEGVTLAIETTERKVAVTLDTDCDGKDDTACRDICTPVDLDPATAIGKNTDIVDLFNDGDPVTVTGDASSGDIVATGGALGDGSRTIDVPDGPDVADLGLAVAHAPFDREGPAGQTDELAVGGSDGVLVFFRTGLEGDCDPRSGAPADVACH